ncbi:MAG: AAA family ATPase [Cyanothece sp. SIO2G6]|nr:AAA family ATPase [Cyanothece sp. SIO2G6]
MSIPKKSILKTHKQALTQWGLTDNPFEPTPSNPQRLIQLFHGRDQELEITLPALYEGRNVILRGAWGVGKTALIYVLLNRLATEVFEDLDESILVLYLNGASIDTAPEFYRMILLAVATEMSQAEGLDSALQQQAQEITGNLTGIVAPQRNSIREGKVNLAFFSFGVRDNPAPSAVLPTAFTDPYPLLINWLDQAQKQFSRVVIAIDDLDKKDTPVVQTILEGSLSLFRSGERRAFLMTGRGFTDLQEATFASLGIFAEDITMESMSPADLRQIVINALNTVREDHRNDPHPFTEDVIDLITTYAQGNPRQLNMICDKLLRLAASRQCEEIDRPTFDTLWPQVQTQVTQRITPQLRKLLYVAYRTSGISEDITNTQLNQLNALTFSELIPRLQTLEQQGLLLRQEDEGGFRFLPSKLFLPEADAD